MRPILLDALGRYTDAVRAFDTAIDLDGGMPRLALQGVALDHLGSHARAVTCYDKALDMNPRHARAWYLKGRALDRQGRFTEAMECFKEAMKGGELS